jgi:O-antigen/teichoic acid export membrane protein
MSSAAKAIAAHRLTRRALSLGAVKAFDHALHFLLPVVLARALDAATFGEYRLIWLVVGTVTALASLNVGGSLYYFLPRSDVPTRRLFVQNTLAYFALAGLVCGFAVSAWNPLHPAAMEPLLKYDSLVPVFVGLWMAAVILDYLPTVEERIRWQASVTLTISALRAALVAAAAITTGDLRVILWLMIAVIVLKLALLVYYVARHHGFARPICDLRLFGTHLRQAVPFGISAAFFSLRAQADQWVAASLFALTSFAAFSVAGIVGQVVHIFRHSAIEAFMPAMSRMEAAGDVRGMMEMNKRANAMIGFALFPVLAAAFAFAEEAVAIIYTTTYLEAAPVIRLYTVGMLALVIEISSVLQLLRLGGYAVRVQGVIVLLSVAGSVGGALAFGLTGAALGSVVGAYLERAVTLRRVCRETGIRLAEVQAWRSLAWSLGSAAFAGLVAWALAPDANAFIRLLTGALILAAVYGALNFRRLREVTR